MTVKRPQIDLPVGITGGSYLWDSPEQGAVVLASDWFETSQALALGTTPGVYSLTGSVATLTATSTSQTLVLEITPGSYLITGSSANLNEAVRLSVTPGSYSLTGSDADLGVTTGPQALALSTDPGAYTLTGFAADLIGPSGPEPEIIGGHYVDWWRKKWEAQFKRTEELPTLEEVEEFVEEQPAQALEALRTVAPSVALGITPALLAANERLIQSIADQLLIAIELRRIQQAEDDDIEAILLML